MDSACAHPSLRLDKWLWYARFFKSRSLAARACAAGEVRLNGTRIEKAHALVRAGDVLTFAAGSRIRVVRVAALGVRRGPAPEAQALYVDLDPPPARGASDGAAVPVPVVARRDRGAGRPTKAERRALQRLRGEI